MRKNTTGSTSRRGRDSSRFTSSSERATSGSSARNPCASARDTAADHPTPPAPQDPPRAEGSEPPTRRGTRGGAGEQKTPPPHPPLDPSLDLLRHSSPRESPAGPPPITPRPPRE